VRQVRQSGEHSMVRDPGRDCFASLEVKPKRVMKN
jgi:hypothetical protein